jgi:SAM-dependent methyltransferase
MTTDVYGDDELSALYDLVYDGVDDDVAMYEGFATHTSTPVLEICAGSGRITLPLARAGHDVVALDLSPHMLSRLRARLDEGTAPRVRMVEGDMRDFDLGQRFDLVFNAFGSFEQLLTTEDQLAALQSVARHLTGRGVFVAELRSLTGIDWEAEPTLVHDFTRVDLDTGERVTKLRSQTVSPSRQTTVDTIIIDRMRSDGAVQRRVIEVPMRAIGRFELEYLLRDAGLRLTDLYGDTSLSPYTDASDRMIVVAELAGA